MEGVKEIDINTNTIQPYVRSASTWLNSSQFCDLKTERITTDSLSYLNAEENDTVELSCRRLVPPRVNIAHALTAASSFYHGLPVINKMLSYILCDWVAESADFEFTNPLSLTVVEMIQSRKYSNALAPASLHWLSQSPYIDKGRNLADKFYSLNAEWERETRLQSMAINIAMHPAYQQIIGMGVAALPLIFQQLLKRPAHWFWALRSITGEDPVSPSERGNIPKMTEAWLNWGREHSYL